MLAAWVDGVPASTISLDDRGLHYGDGLFETIGASDGHARFLEAHLARLAHGCTTLSIPAPDAARLRCEVTRAAAIAKHVLVKLIMTRGAAIERGYAFSGTELPRRIVCAYPWPEGPTGVRAPARAAMAELRSVRPLLAGIKHLNRLEQVLARQEARQRDLDEVILCNDEGFVTGGSMTNVFALVDGQLATPRAALCAVAGVVRGQLLGVAGRLGIPTGERLLTPQALQSAEALWLTNARVGLWPVASFGTRVFAAHEWTPRLQGALHAAAMEAS